MKKKAKTTPRKPLKKPYWGVIVTPSGKPRQVSHYWHPTERIVSGGDKLLLSECGIMVRDTDKTTARTPKPGVKCKTCVKAMR